MSDSDSSQEENSATWLIVVGVILVIALVVGMACFCKRRIETQRRQAEVEGTRGLNEAIPPPC